LPHPIQKIFKMATPLSDQLAINPEELLLNISEGDHKAFAVLFKMYYKKVEEYIFRITDSELLTQEVVQDVFAKMWAGRGTIKEIKCFKAYLLVVARNHAFNCLKRIAREKQREKEWIHNTLKSISQETEESDGIDYNSLIDAAIELLPSQQKKVYLLSRVNKMKQEEIASELNIALETVKKHMVLALRFIKNNIRQPNSISREGKKYKPKRKGVF
jgi:RNA polymerase sigma-70 factor (family 1)